MGSGASKYKVGAHVRTVQGSEAPVGIEGVVEKVVGGRAQVKIEGEKPKELKKAYLRRAFRVGDDVLWIFHDDDVPAGTAGVIKLLQDPPPLEVGEPPKARPRTAHVDFFVDGEYIRRKIACPELERYSYLEAASNYFKATKLSERLEDAWEATDGLFDFGDLNTQIASVEELKSSTTNSHTFFGPVILNANEPDRFSKKKRMNKFRDVPQAEFPVWCIALSPLGRFIASSTADNGVHLWETDKFEVMFTIRYHEDTVWALEFSPNGSYLATGSADKTIGLWDVSQAHIDGILKGKRHVPGQSPPLQKLAGGHTAAIRCMSFSRNGLLISGGMDNQLCVWEAQNPKPLHCWVAHEDDVMDCYFSTINPEMAFSLGQDGTIALWRPIEGEEGFKCRFKGGSSTSGCVLSLALHSRDFYMVASGTQGGSAFIHFFHPSNADGVDGCTKYQHELRGHTGAIWTLAFSKDGCLLATGSADKSVRVWDVSRASYDAMALAHSGNESDWAEHYPVILQVAFFEAHSSFVRMLRWRARAKAGKKDPRDPTEEHSLVTCSPDGTVKIWTAPKQLRKAREWDVKHQRRQEDTGLAATPSAASGSPPSMLMLGDGQVAGGAAAGPPLSPSLPALEASSPPRQAPRQ